MGLKNRRFKNEKYNEQVSKIEKKFETVVNESTSTTEIIIYGDIGESWWGESISAVDIDNALKTVKTDNITVRINSPGGDALDGITIRNRLKDHPANVKIIVDGWACSAASIIAMSADELVMNTGSMLMIHQASTFIYGNQNDFAKEVELLSKLDKSLVDIYMTKAQVEREEIETMIKNETWFTAEEAVAIFGAVTQEPEEPQVIDAEAFKKSVLSRFNQNPNQTPEPKQNSILSKFKRTQE